MDSVTQALLGATFGQACGGQRLGRKAAWWGAAGGVLPDLDTVVAAPFGEFATLIHHRGVSHSLWFGPVVGTAFGYTLHRYWYRTRDPDGCGRPEALRTWIWVFVTSILTHPLLDVFTSYGTQLLAPFSRQRFVFEGVGIVDPMYSLVLAGALLLGRRFRAAPRRAARIAWAALGLTTAYLFLGVFLNQKAVEQAERELREGGITDARVVAYSTIGQLFLRRVVAISPSEVHVGYVSTLRPSRIRFWRFAPERHPLIEKLNETEQGKLIHWMAAGQVVGHVVQGGSVVELDDIRYGAPERPSYGFWGIRAEVGASGEFTSIKRLRRRTEDGRFGFWDMLGKTWPAALGDEPLLYRVGPHAEDPPSEASAPQT